MRAILLQELGLKKVEGGRWMVLIGFWMVVGSVVGNRVLVREFVSEETVKIK